MWSTTFSRLAVLTFFFSTACVSYSPFCPCLCCQPSSRFSTRSRRGLRTSSSSHFYLVVCPDADHGLPCSRPSAHEGLLNLYPDTFLPQFSTSFFRSTTVAMGTKGRSTPRIVCCAIPIARAAGKVLVVTSRKRPDNWVCESYSYSVSFRCFSAFSVPLF